MLKKNTKVFNRHLFPTNSAFEFVAFSNVQNNAFENSFLDKKVLAIQTNRLTPFNSNHSSNHSSNHDSNHSSNSPYLGFNLGLHVGDIPELVEKNRQFLQSTLLCNIELCSIKLSNIKSRNTKIQWLEQVHGNKVVKVTAVSSQPITADAAFTTEKNICLSVMTADCLPILLSSKQGDEIAAIHGGWRSLATNIVNNTIQEMQTDASELCAWLGPCIGKDVFEVGEDVRKAFVDQNALFSQAFFKHTLGKYLADLHCIAKIQLTLLGVKEISVLSECTFSNTDKYYSYRKNSITGRMASLICLR